MLCKESVVLDVPEGYGKRACVDHMEMVVGKIETKWGTLS
jgi:hypothetical protein